jgi:hypothetical protein
VSVRVRPEISNKSNSKHSSAVTAARPRRQANGVATFFAVLPILSLVGLGISAQAQRTIKQQTEVAKYGTSSRDAAQVAARICTQILGRAATPVHVTTQTAFSIRRATAVREWNVVCSTSEGQYLLRINADNHHVYAINRIGSIHNDPVSGLDNGQAEDMAAAVVTGEDAVHLSRQEAEANARRYLTMLGVPSRGLEPVAEDKSHGVDSGPLWNFTFRTAGHRPDESKRILKVSINGGSGDLEHVWNPSSLL